MDEVDEIKKLSGLLKAFKEASDDRLYVTSFRVVQWVDNNPRTTEMLGMETQQLIETARIVYQACQDAGV